MYAGSTVRKTYEEQLDENAVLFTTNNKISEVFGLLIHVRLVLFDYVQSIFCCQIVKQLKYLH